MRRAIALSRENLKTQDGGPFGAVVVKDGRIVGEGRNQVIATNDPTAHAEIVAIRAATQALGTFDLSGCAVYASCEPCPMCLGAILWARIGRLYHACDRHDAKAIGFDDEAFYREVQRPAMERSLPVERLLDEEARTVFKEWGADPSRVRY
ncbi:MAG TPA: nucleoside deaminase [Alphaproteobacteria bacterium]|nr:nucleoside deaminase [Alphaproteobacteria bacterium]